MRELALGGLVSTQNVIFPGGIDASTGGLVPSVISERGDLGAIISTGTGGGIYAGDLTGDAPSSIDAALGNIRVIQASTIGLLETDGALHGAGTKSKSFRR